MGDVQVRETRLPGVIVVEPRVFRDERGYFAETYSAQRYETAGVGERFVQDNVSFSRRGVLRGLHFQQPYAQGKLVSALRGDIFDVAVDIRLDSATRYQWHGELLSAENGRQLYIPPGFAHGFVVLSEDAVVTYKCTEYYRPENERSIRWDDSEIGIEWPVTKVVLSEKDASAARLTDLDPAVLPRIGH